MSSRNTRTVRQVNSSPAVNLAAIAVGAATLTVTAASLAAKLAGSLGAAAATAYAEHASPLRVPVTLTPALTIAATPLAPEIASRLRLSELDGIKLAAAIAVSSNAYVVDQEAVEQRFSELQSTTCVDGARREALALAQAVQESHNRAFVRSLTKAAQNAAIEIGFTEIEVETDANGRVRINASHPSGRAIVTEIRMARGEPPIMESEVVGVSDQSCVQILAAFDAALVKRGVILSETTRKSTGGVPNMQAVLDFLAKRASHGAGRAGDFERPSGKKSKAIRRTQPSRTRQER